MASKWPDTFCTSAEEEGTSLWHRLIPAAGFSTHPPSLPPVSKLFIQVGNILLHSFPPPICILLFSQRRTTKKSPPSPLPLFRRSRAPNPYTISPLSSSSSLPLPSSIVVDTGAPPPPLFQHDTTVPPPPPPREEEEEEGTETCAPSFPPPSKSPFAFCSRPRNSVGGGGENHFADVVL